MLVEWAQLATMIGVISAVIGLQSFWVARALDGLRSEMHRGFDRIDTRFDRLEGRVERIESGGDPPCPRWG